MARNCYYSLTVRHYYVLALPCDPKTSFFKCLDRNEVIEASNFRHLYCNLDLANIRTLQIVIQNFEIFLYRRLDVL